MKKAGIKLKTIPLGQKKVKAGFKKIFEALVKAATMAAVNNWENTAKELASIISAIGLKKETSEIAYYFVLEALINTAHNLVAENEWRFRRELEKAEKLYDSEDYVKFLDSFDGLINEKEIEIDADFFNDPTSFELLVDFKDYFINFLVLFGFTPKEAELIANRIPTYFVYEINDIWRKNPGEYELLLKKIETPFSEAIKREQEWQAYEAWLNFQTSQPVFEEPFSLKDIFIPLRAYYEIESKGVGNIQKEEEKPTKKAVWLEETLDEWLKEKKPKDAIKMISGGPGSGKSSFAKIWAAKVAAEHDWRVLFIPLHLFDIYGSIDEALGRFLVGTPHIPFTYNPLEAPRSKDKFLLIFDGLDELVMQGKTARDSAAEFIDALERHCTRFNTRDPSILKIIIAGRPISVQNADVRLRGSSQQVVHLLPYFLSEEEAKKYIDAEKILASDLRQEWWIRYTKFKELPERGLPVELKSDNLDKLTREPLLNYLIALSWSFDSDKFSENSNINEVYYNLMHGVYKRDYEGRINTTVGNLKKDEFFQILEQIAICAWHGGDVRVTSERKIEKHIHERGLKKLLDEYKDSVKGGVSRLLTAFYFRKYGKDESSEDKDETFEFTHKSFGEYLTARALVETLKQLFAEIQDNKNNQDTRRKKGWTFQEGLNEWLKVAGPTLIDTDLIQLIKNEIQLRSSQASPEPIIEWQSMLCELIAEIAESGMDFQGERHEQKKERLLAQNAEIGLLAMLNCCSSTTGQISKINWSTSESYWNWIHSLYSSKNQFNTAISLLSFLNLKSQDLGEANLFGANLKNSDLSYTYLPGSTLILANFSYSNLQGASLGYTQCFRANFYCANLKEAKLYYANLIYAHLQEANLQKANLQEVNLQKANLQKANLQKANLEEANLKEANLNGANLGKADLRGAMFSRAIINNETNFENCKVTSKDWIENLKGKGIKNFNCLEEQYFVDDKELLDPYNNFAYFLVKRKPENTK